jgi:hypothetical protein
MRLYRTKFQAAKRDPKWPELEYSWQWQGISEDEIDDMARLAFEHHASDAEITIESYEKEGETDERERDCDDVERGSDDRPE